MAKQIWKALDNLSPSDIKLSQLPRKPDGLHNLKVNEYGQLVKRAGYATYNTTVIGGGSLHKIVGMHRYYKQDTSSKEFIVAWNRGWYKLSAETGHEATALYKTGTTDFTTTADQDTYWVDFLNHCYGVNGIGVWKYGGSFVRTVGITVPNAPTYTSFQTDGALGTGAYYFKVTYVDEDGHESDGSDASAVMTTTGDNDAITIGISKSSDDKVPTVGGKRRIYRTSVGGAIYYYDDEVDDNSVESFKSIKADSALGVPLHTNHTAPPLTSHLICKRRNKLYLAYEDYVYPSHTSDVEYFPPLWRLRTGNSQKIMGLLEQLTALPVATEDSIERLVGTDEDNFEFINSYSTEGNVALRSYVNCDNLIVYLGFNGINYFDGVTSGIFSEAVNKYIRDNINGTCRHLSCAAYWDNKYMLCYPKGANTVPNETIWIDLKNKTYGVYNFAFSCFSLWDKGTDGLQLKAGSNTIGQVYSVFSGLDDVGSAITAYDDIEPIDLGLTEVYKQWYSIFIKIKTTDGTALAMFYTLDDNDETSSNMISRDDIAFVDGGLGADTITTVAGDFVVAGFKAGDVLVVTDTDNNNGNMTIVSIAAKTITLATGIVTAETAGDATLTKAKVLTANTTKWYRISLGDGGKMARAFKPRPYMNDKFNFEIHGYMICYEIEPFAEEKD